MGQVDNVWDAVRGVHRADTRLVPGMVSKVEREGDVRKVTFATGDSDGADIWIDNESRRVTYAAYGGRATTIRRRCRSLQMALRAAEPSGAPSFCSPNYTHSPNRTCARVPRS